jgi:hypothetical protein
LHEVVDYSLQRKVLRILKRYLPEIVAYLVPEAVKKLLAEEGRQ